MLPGRKPLCLRRRFRPLSLHLLTNALPSRNSLSSRLVPRDLSLPPIDALFVGTSNKPRVLTVGQCIETIARANLRSSSPPIDFRWFVVRFRSTFLFLPFPFFSSASIESALSAIPYASPRRGFHSSASSDLRHFEIPENLPTFKGNIFRNSPAPIYFWLFQMKDL